MAIVVTLSPELEALLFNRAAQRGQDTNVVASEMLANVLKQEGQELEETIQGIQQGLDDFESDRFQSFDDFANEQRHKYNLPV